MIRDIVKELVIIATAGLLLGMALFSFLRAIIPS